jgi:hypothetical protein
VPEMNRMYEIPVFTSVDPGMMVSFPVRPPREFLMLPYVHDDDVRELRRSGDTNVFLVAAASNDPTLQSRLETMRRHDPLSVKTFSCQGSVRYSAGETGSQLSSFDCKSFIATSAPYLIHYLTRGTTQREQPSDEQ